MALRGATYYARKKDYNNALADLDKSINADGNNALALGERGQCIWRRTTSITHYLISTAPSRWARSVRRPIARAIIEKSKGDTTKAIDDLGLAIKRDPRPADLYFERANLRKIKGDALTAEASRQQIKLG